MVEVRNICKFYGDKVILENLSLTIEKGKITSFIGENGAGKSTLLSIIARLMRSSGGEVFLEGTNIYDIEEFEMAKKVSVLKQANNINIRLTIRELVSFGRFPYSKGKLNKDDEKIINEAISYLGLEDIQHKYIDEISGGQKQRAFIAMVVAQNTEYILLDEPLNNLDMKHSVQIMKILRRLVDELGKTIILVIHDINFASCYSDNIVALKDGKVVNYGNTNDIIQHENLKNIFDMDFNIQQIDNSKICVYFT